MRFLFAWEQGGRLGHLSKMLPTARILKDRGHEVLFAVKEVGTAYHILDKGFNYIQCPIPIGLRRQHQQAVSFADVLADAGFGDVNILGGMVKSWHSVFECYKPNVILSQHAPTVILASKLFNIPCLKLSSGFESPPEFSPYPCMRPWLEQSCVQLIQAEQRLLNNINQVCSEFSTSILSHLYQVVRADISLLATIPELDHYCGRQNERYIGPLFIADEGEAVSWSGLCEQKIFAYLHPGNEMQIVLENLGRSGAEVVAYIPGLSKTLKEKYNEPKLQIFSSKINLAGLLPDMTLALHNANLGSVSATLLAGVPSLCIPTQIEQWLLGCNLERIEVGKVLRRDRLAMDFEEALGGFLNNDCYQLKAKSIAKKYVDYDQKKVVIRLANTLEKMSALSK
jgi:UDP:flavonoid glycosyltransferase YjiC (YdhE family)